MNRVTFRADNRSGSEWTALWSAGHRRAPFSDSFRSLWNEKPQRVKAPAPRSRCSVLMVSNQSCCLVLPTLIPCARQGMLNTDTRPIAHQYCEGQMKSTLHREFKVHEASGLVTDGYVVCWRVVYHMPIAAGGTRFARGPPRRDWVPQQVRVSDMLVSCNDYVPLPRLETRSKEFNTCARLSVWNTMGLPMSRS